MNNFRLWYRPSYYVSRPHKLINESCLKVKWVVQRGLRGYADCDLWGLDGYLSQWMPEALEQFRKTTHGYPCSMTEKTWDTRLSRMRDGFLTAREIHDMNYQTPEEYGKLEKRMQKGLRIFTHYFLGLWD